MKRMMDIVDLILKGDIRTVSRLISLVEENSPDIYTLLKILYLHTGRAYRVGITGMPGSGKSTIIDRMIEGFRERGISVGVIAVDPSSHITSGSLLGDRIRMQRHAIDEGVFIRSMSTRGHLGGIARTTRDVVNILDAAGKEIVIVETVGVGQDEVDVASIVYTTVVVLTPDFGDELQTLKAGLFEIGDIFVINKSDLGRAGELERDINGALDIAARRDGWRPVIVKSSALKDEGITEIVAGIEKHKSYLHESDRISRKKEEISEREIRNIFGDIILERAFKKIYKKEIFGEYLKMAAKREIDPYSAALDMVKKAGF
ncbi:MAG TPA: methylmalonyl Co-A mutase-associated GTPase MeaB [Nitrospiria bacterium]|nr:methylmalonyl Co-A mutase-associated GTPase MeaB [Nitrospiria bacterium]